MSNAATAPPGRTAEFLRRNGAATGAGAVLLALALLTARWVANNRSAPPPPRKVMQYTMVRIEPASLPRPPPPPPSVQPKVEEDPQTTRVDLKSQEFAPQDAPRPPGEQGGGRLSLAAEGDGPGDAFNLVGNPGGRGILTGGGVGDGSGDGLGEGGGGAGVRFGWYYGKMQGEIEAALRKVKALGSASTRVEMRVWVDPSGRIRLQLLKSTGDPRLDAAIQSVAGLTLNEAPPPDMPLPLILRLTARRAQ